MAKSSQDEGFITLLRDESPEFLKTDMAYPLSDIEKEKDVTICKSSSDDNVFEPHPSNEKFAVDLLANGTGQNDTILLDWLLIDVE